jgi:hypothetical protein
LKKEIITDGKRNNLNNDNKLITPSRKVRHPFIGIMVLGRQLVSKLVIDNKKCKI